jgi:DNA-binding CsgD family transcriptional regulator
MKADEAAGPGAHKAVAFFLGGALPRPGRQRDLVILTPREREVAQLLAQGHSNRIIAKSMFVSVRTAEGHVERLRAKLGVATRAGVVKWVLTAPEARDLDLLLDGSDRCTAAVGSEDRAGDIAGLG